MKAKIAVLTTVLALAGAAAFADEGKDLFDKQCAKCHGPDGKGDTKIGKKLNIKDLTDAKIQAAFTDDKAFKSIKEGIKDGDKVVMKPAEEVTDAQIKVLVGYVRKFKK